MPIIYLFSGLGADHRMFANLKFRDYTTENIIWNEPIKQESIEGYAERLSTQIMEPNPIFIGLSFGGIMAIEVAKFVKPHKLILLASIKNCEELPFYFKFLKFIPIHKLIPVSIFKSHNFISDWFFAIENKEESNLLKSILVDTNPDFLIWAINKIVNWENIEIPENLTHIHGSNDRILPIRFLKSDYDIQDGGHFMTINKSGAVNIIINEILI